MKFTLQEFNHPWTLLEKNDSVFKEMINQLEGPLIEQLRSSAKQVCMRH